MAEKMGERSNLLHLQLQDISISKRQIQQKTVTDSVLSQVIAHMERGWPENNSSLPKELHTFFEKRVELSVEENILLWRGRIVVPDSLRTTYLQLLHEGHPGVCSMRELAKFYAWWPHIDDDIEHQVAACTACQQGRSKEPKCHFSRGACHQSLGRGSILTLPVRLKTSCGSLSLTPTPNGLTLSK